VTEITCDIFRVFSWCLAV